MSQKLLDDLKSEIELHAPKVADRITAFVLVVADRVASLGGDAVKASDLAATLRLDPESLGVLIATNPPEPAPVKAPPDAPKDGMKPAEDPATKPIPVTVVDQKPAADTADAGKVNSAPKA